MEPNREHFRDMTFCDFKSDLNQQQCLERLSTAFPDSSPSRSAIFERSCSRPSTAVTDENIVRVRNLVDQDRQISYCSMQASLNID
ncbi:hypothetical protein ILUMI_08093 [Ignelater luminosus]|uniref:Uncharacterized protein n=1 Tax=Ignelater luminosus TaxID=2038154 RepID=A0A8K0D6S0_IGNLU|nr:hypothetical protein ILUMI_08093 [Ignelater luminosus]